ncbi:MAG: winged helix-turn-helix domain-containing protein [Candidatus Bathyarchaeota archaeon]|nr:winged helix-turn-helix domain-containing protein [Candidatus Bathyarchaeota archaeon]
MKIRRSRLEILLDVLNAIKNGTEKPTRIMYECNLSWKLLNDALSSLVSQDLVEEVDLSDSGDKRTNKIYKNTQKGDAITRYFLHAEQLLKLDEPVINP